MKEIVNKFLDAINFNKLIVVFNAGGVMAVINFIFGTIDYSIIFLLLVMVLDMVTGIGCGFIEKSLSSDKAIRGVFKKLFVLVYVIIAHHIDVMLDINYVRIGVCYMYGAGEVLSIIENGTKLGVAIPEPIKKALDIINKKSENKEE